MSEYNAVVGVYHSLGRQEGMPKTLTLRRRDRRTCINHWYL